MNPLEIEQYLIDWKKKEFPSALSRDLAISPTKKITVIIGPRRAGKTFFLYQIMREKIKDGAKKDDILFLNFENTRLFETTFKEIKNIIEIDQKLFPGKTKIIFLDEPQNITNWEVAVRELQDNNFNIYLSGSSSKLLSKEIATSLRGRSLSYLLLPFSFSEFLKSKSLNIDLPPSSSEKNVILSLLEEYLEFGGFPEITFEKNIETKQKIIEDYFELVVYKDLVERYKIKDALLIKWLLKYVSSCYSKEMSVNQIYLNLKSQGRKISKDELYNYISLLSDSFFVFYLPKFSWSVRKREPTQKIYLNDVGFAKISEISPDKGKKMENVVFLQLLRQKKPFEEFFYWKNVQQEEVDFVVKKKQTISQLIQVCYNLEDAETKSREIRSLLKAAQELKCAELVIITRDYEAEETAEWFGLKGKIKFMPLWKWLLRTLHNSSFHVQSSKENLK